MSRLLKVIVLLGVALSPFCAARAADDAAAKKIDPQAETVLRAAAAYLQGLQSFTTDLKSTLHIKAPVADQEIVASYSLAIEPPNRMSVLLKDGNLGATVVCDGKELTIYVPRVNKYSVEEAPKALSELTHGPGLMAQTVHGISFSSLFMLLEPPKEMLDDVDDAQYLGQETLGEQTVHHLKISSEATHFDYWIDTGDKPLVRKVAPNMAEVLKRTGAELPEGVTLDMTALFSNWQSNPQLAAEQFAFSPPAGAEKVDTLFEKPHPLVGKDAPLFELKTLAGKPVKLADLIKDKGVIVLEFWATWCAPCIEAMPSMAELAASYKAKGVVFYAVNFGEDAETVAAFLKKKQLDVSVLLDPELKVADLYVDEGIPETVLIGKDGTVQVVHLGEMQNLKQKLSREIDDLLAGKKLAKAAEKPAVSVELPASDEKPDAK